MMRKSLLYLTVAVCILFLSSYALKTTDQVPMYYVAVGWEESATGNKSPQPVVSNVVYVNCKYHSTDMVVNQLFEFYNAYYKISRNTLHLKQRIAWRFDTSDKAEKKRRELIAGYTNQGWDPLLIYRFSVLCDD